jgi:hypothetical protein
LFGLANQHDLGAEFLKAPAMRVEVTLERKHTYFHAFILAESASDLKTVFAIVQTKEEPPQTGGGFGHSSGR